MEKLFKILTLLAAVAVVSVLALLLGIQYMIFPVIGVFSIIIYLLGQQLIEESKRVDALFEFSADAMFEVDRSGHIIKANDNAKILFGYSEEELLGMNVDYLVPASLRRGHAEQRKGFFDHPEPKYMGHRKKSFFAAKKDGESIPVEISLSFLKNGDKETVLAGVRDISERLQIEKEARSDHLTGLLNRFSGEKTLQEEIEKARRYKHQLSLIMCDIDHFKRVNDDFGHNIGDEVLVNFANILTDVVREVDIACRWGGEEFLVICPNTNIREAGKLAERLRTTVASFNFSPVPALTCSFGVATYNKTENFLHLVKRADDALYRAKQGGRNKVASL